MTPRQKKRFLKQFQAQVEQERNGAPIPGDIAERMTKDKPAEVLWQVVCEGRLKTGLKAIGPKWTKGAAEALAAQINQCVSEGTERIFTKAFVVPTTPIGATGAN